jgi:4-hydroxy-3-polyprenylbenzoate decarboxylase
MNVPEGEKARRIVVGMAGASGAIYGIRLLQVLKQTPEIETHLVITSAAGQTIALETDFTPRQVAALADMTYKINDIAATLSSGSYPFEAMIVVPCSMKTAAAIAWGFDDNLLTRAADVTLKERRRLVVAPRESPLHLGHLRTLTQLAEIGAIVAPLMPGFYSKPESVADMVDHQVGRLLDLLKVEPPEGLIKRWAGPREGSGVGELGAEVESDAPNHALIE